MNGIDRATLRRLLQLASGAAEYRFLFDHLESPAWLGPLVAEGVFNHPPNSLSEGDQRVFLLWPPSRYLVRMAERAPNEVAQVIGAIPDTDNFRIHDDLLTALGAMPTEVSVRLTKGICRWLSGPHAGSISRRAAEIMGQFADAGYGTEALQIAKRLLRLSEPSEARDNLGLRDAQPICSPYDYSWVLEHEWPHVVAAAPVPAWRFIRRLLEVAVDVHRAPETAPHDLSYIWRRTILPSDQTIPYNLKGTLVEAVYRTAAFLVERRVSDSLSLYSELAQERWDIFRRAGLQLLIDLADCGAIREVLVDKSAFDHICLRYEYVALLRQCFGGLAEADRVEILSWIDAGPDLERVAAFYKERTGADPSEDYLAHRRAIWQRDHLAPLADNLTGGWRDRYEELAARFGDGESKPMPARVHAFHGSTSPLTDEQGSEMDTERWAALLKEWLPTAGLREPSPDGLAMHLGREVERRPGEFAARAELFRGIWPIYARTFATSLRNAMGRGERLPPAPVLAWSDWLVGSGQEEGAAHHEDDDPTWSWARLEIAHLLKDWMKAGATLPMANREIVWRLLEALLQDEDPAESALAESDPGTQAVKSVRGATTLAAIEYGRWVERCTTDTGKAFGGMSDIPELATVLEAHLDPDVDPAPAVRSVYGEQFPNLGSLDRGWTAGVTDRIFSWEAQPRLASVAWRSYLDWWLPGQPSFDLLRPSYEVAIDRVSNAEGSFEQMVPEEARLAEHLMLLTLYGELLVSLSDGLLAAWYRRSGDRLNAHAIEFLGRYLSRTPTLHADLAARLTQLWDMRAQACRLDPDAHRHELMSYGWLFSIPALPADWRLGHLLRVLELAKDIENMYFAMEQLVDDAQHLPAQAAQALRLLVSQLRHPDFWTASEQVRAVITAARTSGDAVAAEEARQAVEQLLRLGLEEFRDLSR